MKTALSRSLVVAAVAFSLAPGAEADITLTKVPPLTVAETQSYPENVARQSLGAQISLLRGPGSGDSKPAALLSGDSTASYQLSVGESALLVALPRIENLNSVGFENNGAAGEMTIATSNASLPADSPKWQEVNTGALSADRVQVNIGPTEAKYVRLTFKTSQPGAISGFGIYSTPKVSDFTAPRSGKKEKSASVGLVSYALTDMHANARALYVSSGQAVQEANRMIDDQMGTSYSFQNGDASPVAVIDLGDQRKVNRLSAAYAPRAGKMDFYVLQTLPAGQQASASTDAAPTPENTSDSMTISDSMFAAMQPVGSVTDDGMQGRASVDFPATEGRYVMVRWTPADQQGAAFSLAEISAIGGSARLFAQNTEVPADEIEAAQSSDGKTVLDGKTLIDAKDMPAEGPAEAAQAPGEGPPPTLPQPPPFTFVPVLLPSSP